MAEDRNFLDMDDGEGEQSPYTNVASFFDSGEGPQSAGTLPEYSLHGRDVTYDPPVRDPRSVPGAPLTVGSFLPSWLPGDQTRSVDEIRTTLAQEEARLQDVDASTFGFWRKMTEGISRGALSEEIDKNFVDAVEENDKGSQAELIKLKTQYDQLYFQDEKNRLSGEGTNFAPDFLANWAIQFSQSIPMSVRAMGTFAGAEVAMRGALAGSKSVAPRLLSKLGLRLIPVVGTATLFWDAYKLISLQRRIPGGITQKVHSALAKKRGPVGAYGRKGVDDFKKALAASGLEVGDDAFRAAMRRNTSFGVMSAILAGTTLGKHGAGSLLRDLTEDGVDPMPYLSMAKRFGFVYGMIEMFETMVPMARGVDVIAGRTMKAGMLKVVKSSFLASASQISTRHSINSVQEALEEGAQEIVLETGKRTAKQREREKIRDELDETFHHELTSAIRKEKLELTPWGEIMTKGAKAFYHALGPSFVGLAPTTVLGAPADFRETREEMRETAMAKAAEEKKEEVRVKYEAADDIGKLEILIAQAKYDGDLEKERSLWEQRQSLVRARKDLEDRKRSDVLKTGNIGAELFSNFDTAEERNNKLERTNAHLAANNQAPFEDVQELYEHFGIFIPQPDPDQGKNFAARYKTQPDEEKARFLQDFLELVVYHPGYLDFHSFLAEELGLSPDASIEDMRFNGRYRGKLGDEAVVAAFSDVQERQDALRQKWGFPAKLTASERLKSGTLQKALSEVQAELLPLQERFNRGEIFSEEETETFEQLSNHSERILSEIENLNSEVRTRYQNSTRPLQREPVDVSQVPRAEVVAEVKRNLRAEVNNDAEVGTGERSLLESINFYSVALLDFALNNLSPKEGQRGLSLISRILSFEEPAKGTERQRALDKDFGGELDGPIPRLHNKAEELKRYLLAEENIQVVDGRVGVYVYTFDEENPLGVSEEGQGDYTVLAPRDLASDRVKTAFVSIDEIRDALSLVHRQRDERLAQWQEEGGTVGLIGAVNLVDRNGNPIGEDGYKEIISAILSSAILEKTAAERRASYLGEEQQAFSLENIPWDAVNRVLSQSGYDYKFVLGAPIARGKVRISKEALAKWGEPEAASLYGSDPWSNIRSLLALHGVKVSSSREKETAAFPEIAWDSSMQPSIQFVINSRSLEEIYKDALAQIQSHEGRALHRVKDASQRISLLKKWADAAFEGAVEAKDAGKDQAIVSRYFATWAVYRTMMESAMSEDMVKKIVRGVDAILMYAEIEGSRPDVDWNIDTSTREANVLEGEEMGPEAVQAVNNVSGKDEGVEPQTMGEGAERKRILNESHGMGRSMESSAGKVRMSVSVLKQFNLRRERRVSRGPESAHKSSKIKGLPPSFLPSERNGQLVLDINEQERAAGQEIEAEYNVNYADSLSAGDIEAKNNKEAQLQLDLQQADPDLNGEIQAPRTLKELIAQIAAASPGEIGKEKAKVFRVLIKGMARYRGMTADEYVRLRFSAVTDRPITSEEMEEGVDAAGPAEFIKAMVRFNSDGKALIRAVNKTNVFDMAHELAHVFRRDLSDSDLSIVESWAGIERGGWTGSQGREAEENFAKAFERYLAEGTAPKGAAAELVAVFNKFKNWLVSIYQSIVGSDIDIKISPELRGVFDSMVLGQTRDLGLLPGAYPAITVLQQAADLDERGLRSNIITGEPFDAILYHGTNAELLRGTIEENTPPKGGYGAGIYAGELRGTAEVYGKNIHEIGIRARNPLMVNAAEEGGLGRGPNENYRMPPGMEEEADERGLDSISLFESISPFDIRINGEWHEIRSESDMERIGPAAKAAGHDVVIFRDIRGGRDIIDEEVLILDPSIIFDPTEGSIQQATDKEYMAAVESGDVETQQRLVDEAAKAAGYEGDSVDGQPFFHGGEAPLRGEFRMSEYRPAIFMTPIRDEAQFYAEENSLDGRDGVVTPIYASLKNTLRLTDDTLNVSPKHAIEALKAQGVNVDGIALDDPGGHSDFMHVAENIGILKPRLIEAGFDSVSGTDSVADAYVRDGQLIHTSRPIPVTIAFRSSQVKSANPITRDAKGNVIPLSQRFDPTEASILYKTSKLTANELSFADAVKNKDFAKAQELIDGGVVMNRALFDEIDVQPGATQHTVGTTVHKYLVDKNLIDQDDQTKARLVYGAGNEVASEYFGAESLEPYPPEGFNPTYGGDRSIGEGDIINKKFDEIVNTFVINVVDSQTRDFILKDMANLLEVGGRAIVVTRGSDVKGKLLEFGPMERLGRAKGHYTYQKGFDKNELKSYVEDILGEGFTVETPNGSTASRPIIVFTKNEDITLDNPIFAGPGDLGLAVSPMAPEEEDAPYQISTRLPTAKTRKEDPVKENLIIGLDNYLSDSKVAHKYAFALQEYPGVKSKSRSPKVMIEEFLSHAVENILWLYDMVPSEIRERSKLWYDGARVITDRWSRQYGHPRQAIAGVIASLSPRKDWFMNVSMAERLLKIVSAQGDTVLNKEMADLYIAIASKPDPKTKKVNMAKVKAAKKFAAIYRGQTFNELPIHGKAVFVRVFDEINSPKEYEVISPEGEQLDYMLKLNGEPDKLTWASYSSIQKALSILFDPSHENITYEMGLAHKIRNFYNNILLPTHDKMSVTVDTHAAAAILLVPAATSDLAVSNLFGVRPKGAKRQIPNSSKTGVMGTYGIFAEAYRRAAEDRGVLPREMQSITWEAVRGLFPSEWKTDENKNKVDNLWNLYNTGELNADEVRQSIHDEAGGINPPAWFGRLREGTQEYRTPADEEELDVDGVRGRKLRARSRRVGASPDEIQGDVGPAVEDKTEVGVKLTTRNRRLHRLRSSLPDKPIAGINEVRDIIKKISPALDVIHEEGRFYLLAGDQRIEIRITPHGLRMADGSYIGASIIPAGQSLIDEEGNVIMSEGDLLALSKVTSESVDIKHDVVEWIMTYVLSNDDKDAIMDMFPPNPNRPDEPFHNVAERLAQWTPGSPAGFVEGIFSGIANFARAILSIPLTDEKKLAEVRNIVFSGSVSLEAPSQGEGIDDASGFDFTLGGIFPSASEARKRRAPSERMPFLEDLRAAARVAGMGDDEIRSNLANSSDAVDYLYGSLEKGSGWLETHKPVEGLDSRKTRLFWGDELGGARRLRPLRYPKDLAASFTSLRSKFHFMRANHIYRLITEGNDRVLEAKAALLSLITGEVKMLDLMKLYRKSSKGRINATIGGKNQDYLIDTLLEVYRSSMDEHNLETMKGARELVLFDGGRALRGPIEVRTTKGISQSEVEAIKDIIEGDDDLRKLVAVDVKLKKKEAEFLNEAIERFIDRLSDLGAKVRIGDNNVRIAELTEEMRANLQIDLKEIRSFVPTENYYPNKLNLEKGFETQEGKSFDLSESGMIQWRQERPPKRQSVYLGSFSQHMLSRVDHVSKIYGKMLPLWEAERFLKTKSVKGAIYKNIGKDFHDDLLENLETDNGRSYLKGAADKAADWLIHLTTIQGLVAPVTMMKMFVSFPLGAGPLRNRGNMLKAVKYRITDESRRRMKADAMYIIRYAYGYGGDPNIQESFHRMMAKSVLTLPPRGESLRGGVERTVRSRGLELLKFPDEKALTMLWKAAELDTKEFHPDLSGDQFWNAVSKKWREMVRMTQPISEKSEQGHLIANRRGLTRGLLFYGQRMQMFNQLARDWDDWRNATTDAAKADAYRNLRFSMFNIGFLNASLMSLIGMSSMQMRDWSKALWGDKDDEEPDDQSLIGVYLRGLRDSHLGMMPVIQETSEIFLSPYRAARGPIIGDLKADIVTMLAAVRSHEKAKEDYDEATSRAQQLRAEERMGQSLRKFASFSAKIGFYLTGVPARGLEQAGQVLSGATYKLLVEEEGD